MREGHTEVYIFAGFSERAHLARARFSVVNLCGLLTTRTYSLAEDVSILGVPATLDESALLLVHQS